jgi:hypothetical protein
MMAIFIFFSLILYLGFLINWKEMRDVLRQGGWATVCVYLVITVFIYAVLTAPNTAIATGMLH